MRKQKKFSDQKNTIDHLKRPCFSLFRIYLHIKSSPAWLKKDRYFLLLCQIKIWIFFFPFHCAAGFLQAHLEYHVSLHETNLLLGEPRITWQWLRKYIQIQYFEAVGNFEITGARHFLFKWAIYFLFMLSLNLKPQWTHQIRAVWINGKEGTMLAFEHSGISCID